MPRRLILSVRCKLSASKYMNKINIPSLQKPGACGNESLHFFCCPRLQKTFSKFYRRHYELVSKVHIGLKTLLHQGLSEPEFYGDLVYKFKLIVGWANFSDQFKKIIICYKQIGHNINIKRQCAYLEVNTITDGPRQAILCLRASDAICQKARLKTSF